MDVAARVLEAQVTISNEIIAGVVTRQVCERNARMAEWQARWDEVRDALDAILAERGEELATEVAGGATGFIRKEIKGKDADVPVYRIDEGILRMYSTLLEIGKRAAEETGQWSEKPEDRARKEKEHANKLKPDLSKLTLDEIRTAIAIMEKARQDGPGKSSA
jgi:hypothetical protein